jgi:uncharacterized membrane protein YphA (DoxX/SURF4 family)
VPLEFGQHDSVCPEARHPFADADGRLSVRRTACARPLYTPLLRSRSSPAFLTSSILWLRQTTWRLQEARSGASRISHAGQAIIRCRALWSSKWPRGSNWTKDNREAGGVQRHRIRTMENRRALSNLGIYVYGLSGMVLGVVGFVWSDFATDWQHVQASVPHRAKLAYIAVVYEIVGGGAILWHRTARVGAVMLAVLYSVFALLWCLRLSGLLWCTTYGVIFLRSFRWSSQRSLSTQSSRHPIRGWQAERLRLAGYMGSA